MTAETGFIATFYSYKGGVGRTMALANIAVLLAQKGLNTLAIDFDLEAPGLHRYFKEYGYQQDDANEGMLDILIDAQNGDEPKWRSRLVTVDLDGRGRLSILKSGRHDEGYPQRVLDFNWREFFEQRDGGEHIERLRDEWRASFDAVLVDSRTGITDSGGVCTIQLPDILVPMFTANDQSVQGCRGVADAAQQARQDLAFDRPPLIVFPLPSRFDSRAQYEESRTWLTKFADELGGFYEPWVPASVEPRRVLERTKLPYVAYFSFGEKLPVVEEGTSDPEGLGYAFATAAELIAARFQGVEQILFGRTSPADSAATAAVQPAVNALMGEWNSKAKGSAEAHRRSARRVRRIGLVTWLGLVLLPVVNLFMIGTTGSALHLWWGLAIVIVVFVLRRILGWPGLGARHEVAASRWDAVLSDIADIQHQAATGADTKVALELLRARIAKLESTDMTLVRD